MTPSSRHGAYGLRLGGVESVRDLLVPADESWPALELCARVGDASAERQWVRRDSALLRMPSGGQVEVDWLLGRAVFTLPRQTSAAELLHPYLAPVAGIAAYRGGRESFHAGAIVADSGAWAVLGDKGAGKSSLLAWLALHGQPVVADDVVVLDDRQRALAGPRFIDLRAGAAARLGAGKSIGVVGARERYRMPIGAAVPAATPLRGFVLLSWADAPVISEVPAARRLTELFGHRVVRIEPTDASPLLELSTLPMLELRRPRDWRAAGAAAGVLLGALSAAG